MMAKFVNFQNLQLIPLTDFHCVTFRINLELSAADIFEKIQKENHVEGVTYEQDAPQGVRLYGSPGAGKTTFLRHIVHAWSIDFLDKGPQKWTTMVYIPARDIKSTVEQAIKDHLWCDKNDVDILMAHVKKGKGVIVVLDAVDEVRDSEVLESLQRYVHERQTQGGPRIVVSGRNDLCSIDPQDFSRFLTLEGFTIEQGIEYVKQYFSLGTTLPIHQTALEYVNRNKEKMEAVLCNPLKLHIFCALTEKGFLDLGEDLKFDVFNLFEPLEKYLVTREGGEVTEEQSQNFYKLCLFAMLSGMRSFTEALLTQFNIVKNYYVFLVKEDKRNKNAKVTTQYSFTHEMIHEYFASKFIETTSLEKLKSLLLSVCCNKALRNVQKIMFEIIQKRDLYKQELMTLIIRIILILQQSETPVKQNKKIAQLLELPKRISMSTDITQLVLSHQDADEVGKAKGILRKIDDAFDKDSEALTVVNWCGSLQMNGVIGHTLDCMQVCTPHEKEQITCKTLRCLMPYNFSEK